MEHAGKKDNFQEEKEQRHLRTNKSNYDEDDKALS